MPRATRNTNTNNGQDAAVPSKPRTCSKISPLMPTAAPYESTTVRSRHTGATIARSSTHRISSTTASTSGMTTLLSRVAASFMSSQTAVWPPTTASAPETECTAARTRSIVPRAAVESAWSTKVAASRT